eukprot:scaffold20602_cov109-Isochrysis_galbana.AAC.4
MKRPHGLRSAAATSVSKACARQFEGLAVMSADLTALGTALMQGMRPVLWTKRSCNHSPAP